MSFLSKCMQQILSGVLRGKHFQEAVVIEDGAGSMPKGCPCLAKDERIAEDYIITNS
jgi:hypothetical protein